MGLNLGVLSSNATGNTSSSAGSGQTSQAMANLKMFQPAVAAKMTVENTREIASKVSSLQACV